MSSQMKCWCKLTWLFLTIVLWVYVLWIDLKSVHVHRGPVDGKGVRFTTPWKESTLALVKLGGCPELGDQTDWTFQCKYKCPNINISFILSLPRRRQLVPVCLASGRGFLQWEITSMNSVPVLQFKDPCVESIIHENCSNNFVVPNIVHYVWFSLHDMKFEHFLSLYSTYTIQQPCMILIHGDFHPSGHYWRMIIRLVPNIIFLQQTPPESMAGRTIRFIEHKSDITRIKVLTEYGGIYMDFDTIQLASLDPLRLYEFTMGVEADNALASFILLANRNATFLHLWMKGYDNYIPHNWGYNALQVPSQLSKQYPETIHIEKKGLTSPTYQNRHQIFKTNYNWSQSFTIHLYIRMFEARFDISTFRTMNTTLGAVSRYVLFGHKELCIV